MNSTLNTSHFTLRTLHFTFTLYILHFTFRTLHSTLYTLYTSHLTLDTALHASHSTHHTLHFMHYTLHHALHGLHSTLYPPTLYTAHSTLHTLHSTTSTLHLHFTLYTVHCTLHTLHFTVHTLHFKLYTFILYTLHFTSDPHNFALFTLYAAWIIGQASFLCWARAPTSCPQVPLFTALLLPALPKVHSDAEGGPLNLPQSLVIMLAMLNFFILFVQQYTLICSHPRPLQDTLPQYVGLDVYLTNMPQLQTRSSTLTKKLRNCAVPFVFHAMLPAKLAFVPYPWAPLSSSDPQSGP